MEQAATAITCFGMYFRPGPPPDGGVRPGDHQGHRSEDRRRHPQPAGGRPNDAPEAAVEAQATQVPRADQRGGPALPSGRPAVMKARLGQDPLAHAERKGRGSGNPHTRLALTEPATTTSVIWNSPAPRWPTWYSWRASSATCTWSGRTNSSDIVRRSIICVTKHLARGTQRNG
jgi:hypothetical protein